MGKGDDREKPCGQAKTGSGRRFFPNGHSGGAQRQQGGAGAKQDDLV